MGGAAAPRMVDLSVGFLGTEIEYLNAFAARNLPLDSSSNSRGYIFGEKATLQNPSKISGCVGFIPFLPFFTLRIHGAVGALGCTLPCHQT